MTAAYPSPACCAAAPPVPYAPEDNVLFFEDCIGDNPRLKEIIEESQKNNLSKKEKQRRVEMSRETEKLIFFKEKQDKAGGGTL